MAQIGPYKLDGLLGAGGMGQVYRATDTRLHRFVAIKVLPSDKSSSQHLRQRFIQEARAASALNHPNIITVYDLIHEAGSDYLVMELVEGVPLDKLIAQKEIEPQQLRDYAAQVAGALAAAHAAQIIHRDIKPSNVIVTPDGRVKVLDFGLAKIELPASAPRDETRTVQPPLTEAGMVMGTVAYMSPEQARGEKVDARTDLFSLGAMMYEMAARRRPFSRAFDWTSPSMTGVAPPLRPIILKLLRPEREQRYQSAADLLVDLEKLGRKDSSAAWKWIAAGLFLALGGVGAYTLMHQRPKLTDKDTIVLADFANSTGDPVFDLTMRQGLSIQLKQSPFLSLVSDQHIKGALRLMGKTPDTALTGEVARDVCERTSGAAVLDGSIAKLGSQYVIGLRARACRTGDTLDEEQAQAARKEDVLDALSRVSSQFRQRVGESLATIEKHSLPLEAVTTPSLEALKAYSEGRHIVFTRGEAQSIPSMERAIELDRQFAMPYAMLARAYGSVGDVEKSAESTAKAYALRDRTSDAEKFLITASYDNDVTGNLERMQKTCELWSRTYPRSVDSHTFQGGLTLPTFGKYEQALAEAKKGAAIDPDFTIALYQISFNSTFAGRLDESERVIQETWNRKLDNPLLHQQHFDNAFLKGDRGAMEHELQASGGNDDLEDVLTQRSAFVAAYSGHVKQAHSLSQQAASISSKGGRKFLVGLESTGEALWLAFFGMQSEARATASSVSDSSKNRDLEYGQGLVFALTGETSRAQALINDLGKRFPQDTAAVSTYVPTIRAALALNRGEAQQAVEALRVAAAYETGTPPSCTVGFYGILYPAYLRGLAFLALKQGAQAAAEFQKVIAYRNVVNSDPIGALAHLQLGRAFALAGEKGKAKAEYSTFLDLWKDADADVPVLRQARAEFSRL